MDALRPPVLARLGPAHWIALDSVVAVAGVTLAAVLTRVGPGPHGLGVLDLVVLGLSAAAVALRRRLPRGALAAVVLVGGLAGAATRAPAPVVAVAFVMYLVPLAFPRRAALWLLAGTVFAMAAGLSAVSGLRAVAPRAGVPPLGPALDRGGAPATTLLTGALLMTVAWTVGYAVAQQRRYAARRAEEQVAEARRAMSEERLRIARELHDVVAHTMSLIAVQAGVANHVADERPEEARRALSSIEETSRGALSEMRALLGVLRHGDGAPPADPAPGLGDVNALVERAAEAGVRVDVRVTGRRRDLSPGLELAAYRVVQEAITNVVKHAATAGCRVTLDYGAGELGVEVVDDGRGCAVGEGGGAGHGIAGMRERVAMYGGRFAAVPGPERGFRVSATFPLAPGAAP